MDDRFWRPLKIDSINRTKVELKSRNERTLFLHRVHYQSYQSGIEIFITLCNADMIPAYQSYQSGIEIWYHFSSQCFNWLSIVPKWNWNLEHMAWTHTPLSINRTKVELKLQNCWHKSQSTSVYQSYQSGIEMVDPSSDPWIDTTYQSYQSGIEIGFRFNRGNRWPLSIVPKWNWNRQNPGIKAGPQRYQSYQSGIEIL